MGILSKLFGGNHDEQSSTKNENWQVDSIPTKSEWQGTFYDRKEACPDCNGINLCQEHFEELKRSLKPR